MDDIRRPYRGERRDYAIPSHRPAPHPSTPRPQPTYDYQPPRPVHHPTPTQPQPRDHQPSPHTQPAHHHVHAHPQRRGLPKIGLNKSVVLATILAGAAIFGGYLLLKPDKAKVYTPASLAKQISYGFYYPSPLPAGYSYINNINAFQDDQAYYMLGNGNRHIIVHEQSAGGGKLDTKSLSDPVKFTAAGGQAALGNVAGQAAGLVITGSTLITINTTGSVPPADLAELINNLRLVNR